jgi:hypothetical protein
LQALNDVRRVMPGQRIGSTIAATFGLVYVLVNAAFLPAAIAWPLRVLAMLGFAAVFAALWRGGRDAPASTTANTPADTDGAATGSPFGLGFWVVIAIEVVALFGGIRVLTGPLGYPDGGVAWVSFVVGLHFFGLAVVLHAPFFNWLGAAVTLCGVIGLVLVFAGADQAWIATIAGVIPGALLLGFGWWGATNRTAVRQRKRMPSTTAIGLWH